MNNLICGDNRQTLKTLPDKSVQCIVTSPPYFGLRDYGTAAWEGGDAECDHSPEKRGGRFATPVSSKQGSNKGSGTASSSDCPCGAIRVDSQIGLESTPELYVAELVAVFRECKRVLKDDGTLFLNLGDSYWGGKGQSGTRGEDNQEIRHEKGASINRGYQTLGGAGLTRPTDGKHPVIKPKDLIGIPWMVAFALRADGWYLRSDIIWAKPNPMPESVRDRPTRSHEYIFLLSKSSKYYYDYKAILEPANYDGRKKTNIEASPKNGNGTQTLHLNGGERWSNKIVGRTEKKMAGTGCGGDGKGLHGLHSGYQDADGKPRHHFLPPIGGVKKAGGDNPTYSGNTPEQVYVEGIPARNKRDVWFVSTKPYKEAHFATFPPDLIEPCILAGSRIGDTVLDPFNGAGTTCVVSIKNGRDYIGLDLNPGYIELTKKRLGNVQLVIRQESFGG
jgi:site-specific DNA-methyltransferase (adenine-specific)